ncbi:hypothetical protein [Gaetbulibacter sp. NE]|uniref:hypothetical protein n=1 Tax=Gaetbulibacter sp. NE TaxID=2982307 RepID=UPI0021CFB227|nr:hypothetical protein [Gaetbulibacter sp. NE]
MKKIIFTIGCLTLLFSTSCQVESVQKDEETNRKAAQLDVPQAVVDIDADIEDLDDPCISVSLIAGQHHVAGDVSIYNDGENLFIVFTTNGDWVLGTTHLSLGNCDENWVPLTGSGNPQIGQFPFTDPIFVSDYEVIYAVSLEDLGDNYCFAAHAEVEGPDGGETAWAEGAEFDGNSWAMFVETTLSDCPSGGSNNQY